MCVYIIIIDSKPSWPHLRTFLGGGGGGEGGDLSKDARNSKQDRKGE